MTGNGTVLQKRDALIVPPGAALVELNKNDLLLAGIVGVCRHVEGTHKEGRYGVNNSTDGWQIHCDGTCGEMAVAKYLNVFWNGALGDFGARDAGPVQVRTTSRENGHLLLHPGDRDDDLFVMVLSHASPRFILRGFLRASLGKQARWWKNGAAGRPAFWVPQDELIPMTELREALL